MHLVASRRDYHEYVHVGTLLKARWLMRPLLRELERNRNDADRDDYLYGARLYGAKSESHLSNTFRDIYQGFRRGTRAASHAAFFPESEE
jgi:hypothetical protein